MTIPDELKKLKQWVCVEKNSKVPMRATSYQAAASNAPDTWSSFDEAMNSVDKGNYDNVGFVFHNNGIVGIDIDAGFDEEGFISPLAADIIATCHSYTEISRSGRGFHILVKGTIPFKGKNNRAGVEIYRDSRYFILTGNVFMYNPIIENQEAINHVLEKYFPEQLKESKDESVSRIYNPEWPTPEPHKVRTRPIYPRIPNGCRNICLTSLAGMLHNMGYTKSQILDEISYANHVACDPSLPDWEVETIASSVCRYKR